MIVDYRFVYRDPITRFLVESELARLASAAKLPITLLFIVLCRIEWHNFPFRPIALRATSHMPGQPLSWLTRYEGHRS